MTQEFNRDNRHALRPPILTPGNKLSITYRLPRKDESFQSSAAEDEPQAFCSHDVSEDYDSQCSNADPAESELTSCNTAPEVSVAELLKEQDATVAESVLYSDLEKPRGPAELKPVAKFVKSWGLRSVLTKSRTRRWIRQGIFLGLVILFVYFYRHGTQDEGRSLTSGLFSPLGIDSPHDSQTVNRRRRHNSAQDEETQCATKSQNTCASFPSIAQPGASGIEVTKVEYQLRRGGGGQIGGERVSQRPLLDWIDHALGWKGDW